MLLAIPAVGICKLMGLVRNGLDHESTLAGKSARIKLRYIQPTPKARVDRDAPARFPSPTREAHQTTFASRTRTEPSRRDVSRAMQSYFTVASRST
jgi:hypothetical protein